MRVPGETVTQRRERRVTAWGLSFTWLLVIAGVQAVAAVVAAFGLIGAEVIRNGSGVLQNQSLLTPSFLPRYLGMIGWILIVSDVATVLIFLLVIKARHASFRETVGLRRFRPLLIVALLMLGAGLSLILNSWEQIITVLFPAIANSSSSSNIFNLTFSKLFTTIPGVLSIVVFAPITEEIAFRGMVFGTLREKLALPAALVIQAVIFGVFHGNISQGLMAIGLGCLLAWVYLRSGSIVCSMLLHFAFNGTTALIALLVKGPQSAPIWLLVMLLAAGLFTGGLLWQIALTRKPRPLAPAPAPASAPAWPGYPPQPTWPPAPVSDSAVTYYPQPGATPGVWSPNSTPPATSGDNPPDMLTS